jgi:ABC-type transport system substrate-binding protein
MRSIRRSRDAAACAAIALALSGSAGCSGDLAAPIAAAHPDDETPRRGGTLRLSSFGDLRGLDPPVVTDGLSAAAVRLIFAGLVEYDDEGNVVPELAERVETADQGLTYRFFLRQGVRFHDGEELTAADVKRSFERALHATTPNPSTTFYDKIEGLTAFAEKGGDHLDAIRVEGRYVVSIRLHEPDATFLQVLALTPLRIVCKSAGERYADGWSACGAGPFKLPPGGWDRGRSLTLVRHEAYFVPGLPHLDAVSWTFNMSLVAERLKFENGEVDLIRDLSQPDTTRFQADPRWMPFRAYESERTIAGEALNTEMPPFDNVEVRRAVVSAIDREHIVLVKPSNLRAAGRAIPPSITSFEPSAPAQTYDYAAALEHMRKAGYPFDPATGRGGYPGVISYVVYKQGLQEFTGQVLQQDLAKIGIRLELKVVSFPTYLALSRRRGRAAISPQSWSQDFPDPSSILEPLFTRASINDEDSSNAAFYKNAAFDDVLQRAHRELDPATRKRLYAEADRMLLDDAPWAFTYTYRFFDVHQPYVRGYHVHPVWQQAVARSWIDRAAAAVATGGGIFSGSGLASLFWNREGR